MSAHRSNQPWDPNSDIKFVVEIKNKSSWTQAGCRYEFYLPQQRVKQQYIQDDSSKPKIFTETSYLLWSQKTIGTIFVKKGFYTHIYSYRVARHNNQVLKRTTNYSCQD